MADSIFLDFGNRSLMEVILPMMTSLHIEIFVWGLVFGVEIIFHLRYFHRKNVYCLLFIDGLTF